MLGKIKIEEKLNYHVFLRLVQFDLQVLERPLESVATLCRLKLSISNLKLSPADDKDESFAISSDSSRWMIDRQRGHTCRCIKHGKRDSKWKQTKLIVRLQFG
ncbi:hypothetical protein NE237_024615 [Protea cynaroides]|uniref:Uncharacterized protein n=1 Tax=Protea cynaroides TaxID=273540 RepID=A0A9Q0H5H7_9MAGN|nr:hypothetical protein NE237_024615 [Protea cynaroides]